MKAAFLSLATALALALTAGTVSAHPPGFGYPGYGPDPMLPGPGLYPPRPVVVMPAYRPGISIGFGFGGYLPPPLPPPPLVTPYRPMLPPPFLPPPVVPGYPYGRPYGYRW